MDGDNPSSGARGVLNTSLLIIVAVVLACAALKAAQIVFVPILLAVFLAILAQPPLTFLGRYLNRWVSLLVVLTTLLLSVVGAWTFVALSARAVAERGPTYLERIFELAEVVVVGMDRFGLEVSLEDLGSREVLRFALEVVSGGLMSIATGLGIAVLVSFMLVMMLLERDSFQAKIRRGLHGDSTVALFALVHSVTQNFQRFFLTKTWISLLTGAVTTLVTWALGLDFPFVWGTMTFLLNFIPNLGSIIAVFPPTAIALLQFEGPGRAVATLGLLAATQVVIGNFLDPRWMGRSLSLSPLIVFVSMVFWGWMWGVIGIFLAVPLTVLMRIIFEHVPALQPLAMMMGGIDAGRAGASVMPITDFELNEALAQARTAHEAATPDP